MLIRLDYRGTFSGKFCKILGRYDESLSGFRVILYQEIQHPPTLIRFKFMLAARSARLAIIPVVILVEGSCHC